MTNSDPLDPPRRPDADNASGLQPVRVPVRWVLVVLLVGALVALWPLWVPLVLAAWATLLARPLHVWLSRKIGGSGRAAGVVTVALVLLILGPLVITGVVVAGALIDLGTELQAAGGVHEALGTFLYGMKDGTKDAPVVADDNWRQVVSVIERHGSVALRTAGTVFGAVTTFVLYVVVFLFSFYTFLVQGRQGYAWFLDHSPLPAQHLRRLGAAFEETGRGLLIGFGLTALLQGAIAGLAYAVIGVPRALMLGVLTSVSAFIPVFGTGIVWGPVTIALFLGDRPAAAIATLCVGAVVASLDNFVRPALARYGQLQLPTFLVFVAMLGGVVSFGPGGLLLGPLFVRLLVEGLKIGRED